jgi:nitrous oxidase accessory protein NosD
MRVNGEIDVLDPGGYGPLNITGGGLTIQAHGFAGITQTASCQTCAAITISVTTGDPVTLNGLLLDGAGMGHIGILITEGSSVQILNSVIRHFEYGIYDVTSTSGSNLLVEDTTLSDNAQFGMYVFPTGPNLKVTLSRITANNNQTGVITNGNNITIANSVLSNNSNAGLGILGLSNIWLAKNVISGNLYGVLVVGGGTVFSYGDNYINDNGTPVMGTRTPVGMQ